MNFCILFYVDGFYGVRHSFKLKLSTQFFFSINFNWRFLSSSLWPFSHSMLAIQLRSSFLAGFIIGSFYEFRLLNFTIDGIYCTHESCCMIFNIIINNSFLLSFYYSNFLLLFNHQCIHQQVPLNKLKSFLPFLEQFRDKRVPHEPKMLHWNDRIV